MSWNQKVKPSTLVPEIIIYEPDLGNPPFDNYQLSSTAAGIRSWVPPNGTVPLTANWAMGAFELSQATWKGVAIAPAYGGIGAQTPFTIGDILYADSATTFAKRSSVAAGQVLASNGVGVASAFTASPTLTGTLSANNLTATPTLGSELITNFAGWTDVADWAYASSKWTHAATGATALVSDWLPTANLKYKIVVTIAHTSGTGVVVSCGGQTYASVAATSTFYLTAITTGALTFTPSANWVGNITAVSVMAETNGALTATTGTFTNGLTVNGRTVVADWSWWGIKNLRLVQAKTGDHTRVQINPDALEIPLKIGGYLHVMMTAVDVNAVNDLDTGTLAAGVNYYIYACTDGATLSFKVSASSTTPAGFDAAHSRNIGGFHTLCVAVGTISGHLLSGYAVKDILPASIWDLKHRAKNLVNVGLVYDARIQKWVDIYLASGTGAATASVYGGTISDNRDWNDFTDDAHAVSKQLLTDREFQSIAAGSNEETNINGSVDPVTTGGHSDTAGRRMISNIGVEDACGAMWQWLQDQSSMTVVRVAGWFHLGGNKGYMYRPENTEDVKLLAGGSWNGAALCGSRSRFANYYRWSAYAIVGVRCVAEPL